MILNSFNWKTFARLWIFSGLAGSILIVFLALPPFHTGLWSRVGSVTFGLHAAALVCASGLLLSGLAEPRTLHRVASPPALCAFALGLWGVAGLINADTPMVSWLGAPEYGEGILWYWDMAVLIAAAGVLWDVPFFRRGLALIAALSAIAAAALTGTHSEAWMLYRFPDHLAFYGIFIVAVLFAAFPQAPRSARSCFVLCGGALILWSRNNAAILYGWVAAPLLWWWLISRRRRSRGRDLLPVLALAVISPLALFALYFLQEATPLTSLGSRERLAAVVVDAIAARPDRLLLGGGWGHFTDALLRYPLQSDVALAHGGAGYRWDALDRLDFHSHNQVLSVVHAAGLVGLTLFFGIFLSALWRCRRGLFPVAASVVTVYLGASLFWFQYPGSIPFMAMALGAIAGPGRRLSAGAQAGVRLFLTAFLVLNIASLALLHATHAAIDRLMVATIDAHADSTCGVALHDYGRGGNHLAKLLLGEFSAIKRRRQSGVVIAPAELSRLDGLLCLAESQLQARYGLRLNILMLLVRAELALVLTDDGFTPLRNRYLPGWPDALRLLLEHAPRRGDLAIPYLSWLTGQGREGEVLRFAEGRLLAQPDDAVGLWFSGLVLLGDENTAAAGLERMRESLREGIERLMPLEDDLRRQLLDP